MVEQAGALPGEAETSLADSREQFVGSLGRRLEALRQALFALEQAPRSSALRDHLRRRIHAFGASAGVLGFDRVFEAFREAESVLGRAGITGLSQAELAMVARTVDLVPSLVLGAGATAARGREGGGAERRGGAWPTGVLVYGTPALAEALAAAVAVGGPKLECQQADDPGRAEELVRVFAPEVAVIDVDREGTRALIETLIYDPLLDPVRVIALGTFERPEAAASFVALGVARVLPKPVTQEALKRAVVEVSRERAAPVHRADPIGEVTVEALGERLAQEIRRGLVDAVKPQGRNATVSIGEGTDVLAALWSSVARIRELVTLRSGGHVRFDPNGPEGAVPLAPWMNEDRPRATGAGEGRGGADVSLTGRTVVVADDDPAVVWFLSGLLRGAGAEVLEAHDGARALDLVREYWPDVVVSDIVMPELDGFALCREIKRDIALADVPVILLSWKEDLLQRVRELGADADGYLRKEATASTVVQRVREVLAPRARVEARVEAGGDARGRLDGLTPRLVLDIVCRHGKGAHVTMRDAAYLYEVDVRDGRVRSATRTTSDGTSERGERALSGLLGVRAGRFAIRADDSTCDGEWDAPLRDLVRSVVERARAAQRVLGDLRQIARVDIDEAALAPYLSAVPQSVGAVVRRLAEGIPPSDVVTAGASTRLVESVLVDVVLHGALSSIIGTQGEDLLASEVALLDASRARVSVAAARDFRTPPPPGVQALAAAREPSLDTTGSPGSVSGATTVAARSPSVPSMTIIAPRVPPPSGALREAGGAVSGDAAASGASARAGADVDAGFAALLGDSIVPPPPAVEERRDVARPSQKGLAPPTSVPGEPSPLEVALRSLPSSASSSRREAVRPTPAGPVAEPAPIAPSPRPPAAEPLASTVGAAAPSTETPAAGMLAPPRPRPVHIGPPRPERRAAKVEEAPAVDFGDAVLSALGGDEPPARPPASPRPAVGSSPEGAVAAAGSSSEGAVAAVGSSSEGAVAAPTDAVAKAAEPIEPAEESEGAIETAREETETVVSEVAAVATAAPATVASPTSAGAAEKPREATATTRVPAPASSTATHPEEDGGGWMGGVVVALIAGASTFALFHALGSGDRGPTHPASVASANPSVAAPATAVPGAESAPTVAVARVEPGAVGAIATVEELALPAGLTVEPDRGLLEVEAPDESSISVDGVALGKGPLRQLPVRQGPHEVRVQSDSMDVTRAVDVAKGRRTRVAVTSSR